MTIFNSANAKSLVKGENFKANSFKEHFKRHFNHNRIYKSRVVYNSNIKHTVNRLVSGRDMSYSQYIKVIRGNKVQLVNERNNNSNKLVVSKCNLKTNRLNEGFDKHMEQNDV
jgi:hypothetical protein